MLGYFRLFLAFCVMFSHFKWDVFELDIGRIAVFSFFVLAGYVSTKVYLNVYNSNVKAFLKDRFLRIYPAYFVVTTLAYVFFLTTRYNGFETTLTKVFFTYLVIPLNYILHIDMAQIMQNTTYADNFILAPYWSLGAEIQVYIILALNLFVMGRKGTLFLIYLSLAFFTLGTTASDINLTYILLLGTFWSFGLGYLYVTKSYKHIIAILVILFFNFMIAIVAHYSISCEVIVGVVLVLAVLNIQTELNIKLIGNKVCGNMSYHIFLVHYLFIWVSKYLFDGKIYYSAVILASLVFSVAMLSLDKQINKIRKII